MEYCETFSEFFVVRGKDNSEHAKGCLSGLLGRQQRKNIGQIEEDVAGSNYQAMQQLITDSPWDHEAVMEKVAVKANGMLGGHRHSALYVDESAFVKKGEHSVGVKRQYCGRLGKIENCQVGVYACLGRGERSAVVDFRLFVPEEWAGDEGRCKKAKIPEAERRHRTKPELALLMVKAARERGLSYEWVGGDEVYGNNLELTQALDDMGEVFVMDVARNSKVWDRDPRPLLPEQAVAGARLGRPLKRTRASEEEARYLSLEALVKEGFAKDSRQITIRETTKGALKYRLWVREVWQWEPGSEQARRRLLVVRQEADGRHKYSLSNARRRRLRGNGLDICRHNASG
jgi:SRSO17 transposase